MDQRPLLSIAIPTFNRAEILNNSLARIIPQIVQFADRIELIVSDNCSTDHTQQIVSEYKSKNPSFRFISHLQVKNTGYYGNFKTCKELSIGQFFWLLSDNEYLTPNAIEIIINNIQKDIDCGAFYLNNLSELNSTLDSYSFIQNAEDFFNSEEAYKITLISSVVFYNIKDYDSDVFTQFENNLFLGFLLLCNSLTYRRSVCSITAPFYKSIDSTVSFNVFDAWTLHIDACITYMLVCNLLNDSTKIVFVNGFLRTNVYSHVLSFRRGKLVGLQTYNRDQIKLLLDNYYLNYTFYKKNIRPFIGSPKLFLWLLLIKKRIKRLINNTSF